MALKNTIHEMAKTLAERTSPDYVPPPPPPLNAADKHRVLKIKAKLNVIAEKMEMLAAAISSAHKELAPYQFAGCNLAAISESLNQARGQLTTQANMLEKKLEEKRP